MAKKLIFENWDEGEVLGVIFNGELLTGPLPPQFQTEPELGGNTWMHDPPPVSPTVAPASKAKKQTVKHPPAPEALHPARMRRPPAGG